MSLAPIGISTYSRLQHLKQTIEALKANTLATRSDLYIFSDAPKQGDEEKVARVRNYIHSIDGFKTVNIFERTTNSVVKNNRGGIKQLLDKYGRIIFMEDDIVTAPGFLQFMNESLNIYEKDKRIFSITGYSPPIDIPVDYCDDVFILRRASAWGMGLWHDRYKEISYLDNDEVQDKFSINKEVEELSKYGEDLLNMILLDAAGKIDAFDVKVFYYQFMNEKYTIYPRKSLVRNIGFDGSGIHCGKTNKFDVDLWGKFKFEIDGNVKLDDRIIKSNYRFRNFGKVCKVMRKLKSLEEKNKSETDKLGEQLIFIISQPRAGSTLLQRILGSHPDVHTVAEPWIMLHPLYALKRNGVKAEYVSSLARQGLDDFLMQVPEGEELYIKALREMASVLYNRALELSGKSFFLDKTPRYYFIIPELYRVFPNAKFIFLLRNPMAVLSSVLRTWLGNQIQALVKSPNYIDLTKGPHYLIEGIKKLKEDAIVVHYENLVREPKEVIQHVCNRIGIPFHENMLKYGQHPAPKGRFGDSVGVHKHNRPVSVYIDKWVKNLTSPNLIEFAHQYLSALGSDILSNLGYSYQEIKDKLESERVQDDQKTAQKKIKESSVLNEQGEELFKNGDVEGALNAFTKAIEINPNFATAHNNLGVLYWQTGEVQKAVEHFAKALEIDPNDRITILNIGDLFKSVGKFDDARNNYLSYLSRNPEDEDVTLAWGELKDKEEDKAIVEIRKAEAKDYLVSAIVSTYCSEEFMRECLENLEDQTISNRLEIVVVDAASPQNEGGIVKEFQKRYSNITYIRTKNRIDVYTAWNIAIKASSCKYCISVSTNDHLRREACEILARALDENPNCMLVYGDTYLTHNPHETFQRNNYYDVYQWPAYSFKDLLQSCMVGPHPMWRKSIHKDIGYFDERYIADGDQEFWLRIGEMYPLFHVPKFTGLQWITSNSLSGEGKTPLLEVAQIHAKYQKRYLKNKKKIQGEKLKCSIIIPLFNQIEYTRQCLEALIQNTPDDLYEVIIIDNASTDGTKEFLKSLEGDVKIITNKENLGFAKACNQGARAASGKYLVFLNNDTVPQLGWLEEMINVADGNEDIAIVGSKLLFPDGTIEHAGVAIADSKVGYHLYRGYRDFPPANKPRDFQVVTGDCMLVKKDIFWEVNGFDERYINGCEDIDLCFKVKELGKRIFYNPRSVLTHFESKTESRQDKMNDNVRFLLERWGHKVQPDDKKFLMDDGFRIEAMADGEKKWVYHEELCKKTISIIIVTYNSLQDVKLCINSIESQTILPYELIIIDNNSTDETPDYLKGLKSAHVILNNENMGFSGACNQGIEIAKGEYIVLLNPDTAVTKDWASHMIAHFKKGIGAVGPVSNYVAGLQKFEFYKKESLSGEIQLNALSEKLYQWNRGQGVETKLLIGFCLMIKRDVINKIGMLDEDLFLGSDDLEYSWRLRNKGYKLMVATDTFIYHKGQASFKTEPGQKMTQFTQESQDVLYSKLETHYGEGNVPSPMELWNIGWFKPTKAQFQSKISGTPLISIIILAHNQLEYTQKCIDSIFKYTKELFELIVVDNGSTDGTVEYLEAEAERRRTETGDRKKKGKGKRKKSKKPEVRIKIIKNKENLGFAVGNNQGMAEARGNYVVLMNNDLVVTPGWLTRMMACAERNPQIGIVGPMSNYVSGPQLIKEVNYDTTSLARLNKFSNAFSKKHAGQAKSFWRVVGFCMLIKRAVIEKIGGLDGRFGLGNFEDDDFSLRAALAGFESWIAQDCFVHHFGSRTFAGAKIDYRESLHKNWEIFKQKWGIPADVAYGAPYDMASVVKDGFIPAKHYCPLTPEEYSVADGEKLFGMGDIEGAKRIFEQVLSADPNNIEPLNNLGVIAFQQGGIDQAISYFTRVLETDEKYFESIENLGKCAEAQKDYLKAAEWFEQALKLKPDDIGLLNSLGNCFIQAEDFVPAGEVYEKSLGLDGGQENIKVILRELERVKKDEH